MAMVMKYFQLDLETKSITEIQDFPSFISGDQKKYLLEKLGKAKEKKAFVYFWKKNQEESGMIASKKAVKAEEIIEEIEHHRRHESRQSSIIETLLEVAVLRQILSSLSGSGPSDEENCLECTITFCPKHPQHGKN